MTKFLRFLSLYAVSVSALGLGLAANPSLSLVDVTKQMQQLSIEPNNEYDVNKFNAAYYNDGNEDEQNQSHNRVSSNSEVKGVNPYDSDSPIDDGLQDANLLPPIMVQALNTVFKGTNFFTLGRAEKWLGIPTQMSKTLVEAPELIGRGVRVSQITANITGNNKTEVLSSEPFGNTSSVGLGVIDGNKDMVQSRLGSNQVIINQNNNQNNSYRSAGSDLDLLYVRQHCEIDELTGDHIFRYTTYGFKDGWKTDLKKAVAEAVNDEEIARIEAEKQYRREERARMIVKTSGVVSQSMMSPRDNSGRNNGKQKLALKNGSSGSKDTLEDKDNNTAIQLVQNAPKLHTPRLTTMKAPHISDATWRQEYFNIFTGTLLQRKELFNKDTPYNTGTLPICKELFSF